jgi:hypothetical protein
MRIEEALHAMRKTKRARGQESGFALLLAILALMLLTFLGLTLAATTTTELQIATNYRWSLQALYNAEAGIEGGKRVLQQINWQAVLPDARPSWTPSPTFPVPPTGRPTPPFAGATRDFEMGDCDARGDGVGYGVILNDGISVFEGLTVIPRMGAAHALNGAFTLWVRREVIPDTAVTGNYQDNTDNEQLVLTAEGVAPFTAGTLALPLSQANLARRVIEVVVRRQERPGDCAGRGGQLAGGPEGNNMMRLGACDPLTGSDVLQNLTQAQGGFLTGTGRPTP